MPFILPETYSTTIESGTRAGEPKSKATIAVYKSRLNHITTLTGIDNLAGILAHPFKVIQAIKTLPADAGESEVAHRSRKRTYFSAIFMILPPDVKAKSNMYFIENKRLQDAR